VTDTAIVLPYNAMNLNILAGEIFLCLVDGNLWQYKPSTWQGSFRQANTGLPSLGNLLLQNIKQAMLIEMVF
jgi:hypothetical protein